RATGALQPKAEVWVVGSDNDAFRRGTTDLRGIVFVDDVRGRPAVIVAKDGDYALYRGETVLQPQLVHQPSAPPAVAQAPRQPAPGQAFKEQARSLYAQRQRDNEAKQYGFLRNQVMGFEEKPVARPGELPAPGAAFGGGLGGFGGGYGGRGGGVSAGSV